MNRREFLTVTAAAGTSAAVLQTTAAESGKGREFYELRRYVFGSSQSGETETAGDQKKRFDFFCRNAALPALNRLGLRPIGVFHPIEQSGTVTGYRDLKGAQSAYVLIPHPTIESVATLADRLMDDSEFLSAGSEYIDATREKPAYHRIESSLLHAFTGMPKLETPVKSANRVLQLRIYESPTEQTNLKKIEMFNEAGEIRIFREVGLAPVFFGRALIGEKIPNLTYMLAFESEEKLKENWRKFGSHPDWQKLKAMPEYADKTILSGITNILLKPAEYSQI